ncbi:hypothetical protein NQ317_002185 [Molorchus minor]|uniref:NADH dehydrogenase [ubiquinone] 1 beta subcomplex subunit 10 n=1 Tax=Molorchus minor TaxID=1323400 RepID=A0ABQ9IZQ2_9CUCU|nr:hypothetical protein NQ317_002185 [Molorchus minor]
MPMLNLAIYDRRNCCGTKSTTISVVPSEVRRVPTIDECYTDDVVCQHEANVQYRRDRKVDTKFCQFYVIVLKTVQCTEAPDHLEKCDPLLKQYEEATTNWFIKYGDLGAYHNAKSCVHETKTSFNLGEETWTSWYWNEGECTAVNSLNALFAFTVI